MQTLGALLPRDSAPDIEFGLLEWSDLTDCSKSVSNLHRHRYPFRTISRTKKGAMRSIQQDIQ
jgi:hypothetical protein